MHHTKIFAAAVTVFSIFLPTPAVAGVVLVNTEEQPGTRAQTVLQASGQPYEQDFVLTAYYSPLPDQCCYVMGSYEADKVMNGEGVTGTDGTPVYEGMLAAPKSYRFGTRVVLPGLGTMTVHDRGGAIVELPNGAHRLDVWAGYGEEGLARALAFGVKRIRGTVYPLGSVQPGESFTVASLPAPLAILTPYITPRITLLSLAPAEGSHGPSVKMLQEHLRDSGYFSGAVTGFFGPETKAGLEAFIADYELGESAEELTERTAAYLIAAAKRSPLSDPFQTFIGPTSSPQAIREAQRILRFLGYYRGRTNGVYDDRLFAAILAFQQEQGLVGGAQSPGAGRIGPVTRTKAISLWRRALVARRAETLLTFKRIEEMVAKSGDVPARFLEQGDKGPSVKALQKLLVAKGLFPRDRVSGLFGPVTRDAVRKYQLQTGLIESEKSKGAGVVGPATLMTLKRERVQELYRLVRAEGWEAL